MKTLVRLSLLSMGSAVITLPSFAAEEAAGHGSDHGGGGFMGGIEYALHDPVTLWAFIAFVTFLAVAWKMGAVKAITSGLDNRADQIQNELDEARSLREQAAQALASAERRQQDANDEADAMIEQAKAEAKHIMEQARQELAERLTRREALAEARIARAEAEATEQVRRTAADAATEAARRLLSEKGTSDQFEAAAAEIEKALN